MSNLNKPSKTTKILSIRAMLGGLLKHFAGQTVTVNGELVAIADVETRLNGYVAQDAATTAAEATWKQLLQAQRSTWTGEMNPLMRGVKHLVQAAFGTDSNTLLDFGLTPVHKAVRSVQEKVEAVAKSLATRDVRKTMGPRQKEAIHGTVPAPVAPTAPTAPTAPATPAAPAVSTAPVTPTTQK